MWLSYYTISHKSARQERQEARRRVEAGFLLRVFLRERRYAELGYLLPFPIGPAVKTRCIGPSSWLASYMIDYHGFGHSAIPRMGRGTTSANSLAKVLAVLAELHRLDVLGTRAFRTPAFRVGHLLAFMQFLETDALEAR